MWYYNWSKFRVLSLKIKTNTSYILICIHLYMISEFKKYLSNTQFLFNELVCTYIMQITHCYPKNKQQTSHIIIQTKCYLICHSVYKKLKTHLLLILTVFALASSTATITTNYLSEMKQIYTVMVVSEYFIYLKVFKNSMLKNKSLVCTKLLS